MNNLYNMKCMDIIVNIVECIKGASGILEEGIHYSVIDETVNGNYILDGVPIPEGYTSFNKDRFRVVKISLVEYEDEYYKEFEGE